jgi:Holliday junction DNA helicase RuvA
MIALLRGVVVAAGLDHLVVDVRGVGYKVHVPGPMLGGAVSDDERTLHISTIVREDAFLLYGFDSVEARDTFEVLRGVNKIGPKVALAVLSTLAPRELGRAVAAEDLTALSRVPGIGRKTASRMVLELKGKLPESFEVDASGTAAAAVAPTPAAGPDPLVLALARLDYRKTEIDRALSQVPGPDDAPLEDRLRAALRVLAAG